MPDSFVIKLGEDWLRMTDEQIPSIENAAHKAFRSWRELRGIVINTNILLGISEELGLGLPGDLTREEVERGNDVLRDVYIRWGRAKGEISEESEKFLRGEMNEEDAHKHMGDMEYARELAKIQKAEEEGKNYKKLWR